MVVNSVPVSEEESITRSRRSSISSTDSGKTIVADVTSNNNNNTSSTISTESNEVTTPTSAHSLDAIPLSPSNAKGSTGHPSSKLIPPPPVHAPKPPDGKPPRRYSSLLASPHFNRDSTAVRSLACRRINRLPDLPTGQYAEYAALGVFLLHLVVLVIIAGFMLPNYVSYSTIGLTLQQHLSVLLYVIPIPVLLTVFTIYVWHLMIRTYTIPILRGTLVLSVVLPLAMCILIGVMGYWHWLFFFVAQLVCGIFVTIRSWRSSLYGSVLLREVNGLIVRRVGLWITVAVMGLLLSGYILLLYMVAVTVVKRMDYLFVSFPVVFLLILCLLWTLQITIHFIRLVATRVFAACYWPTTSDLPGGQLSQAIHHSLTHAIKCAGALCYGSLLPTIYPNGFTCRRIGFLARVAAFHIYSFVFVAVVGRHFHPAGWASRTLMQTRRMSTAYTQSTTGSLLTATTIIVSLILTNVTGIIIHFASPLKLNLTPDGTLLMENSVTFVVAVVVCTSILAVELARSGVLTLLVSIAVDPSHFRYDHSEFWDAFSAVYPEFDRLNVPITKQLSRSHTSSIISLSRPRPVRTVSYY
jgi:hypothetical protein